MKNNIKTLALCNRCKFAFNIHCVEYACTDCKQNDGNGCKCVKIKKGEPCPYFEDVRGCK